MRLEFEWDANKARLNLRRHGISFAEAKTVFNDPLLVTFSDDDHSEDEERFISIGLSGFNNVLLVVHTEHETMADLVSVRIISCRNATASERRIYEEGKS
ncbi:MAG: BrnT family toxin [Candidatus Binatia bacterium]